MHYRSCENSIKGYFGLRPISRSLPFSLQRPNQDVSGDAEAASVASPPRSAGLWTHYILMGPNIPELFIDKYIFLMASAVS